MCDGMSKSAPCTFRLFPSVNKQHLSLLLLLTVVSTGQGSGCVRPYMVHNSWVNLTETNRGSVSIGTVLQYSCDPGYVADGPSTLTCTPLGHWSSPPPRCIRSDVCQPPLDLENGGFTCESSPCRRFSHGTVIEYFCNQGFTLKGDYKYLTCRDGQWEGTMQITCVNQGCVRPYMVQHSTTNLTETNHGSVSIGTVLQYSCDPGYVADGPCTLTCTPLGHWSSPPPRCIRSDVCLPPYQPENGGYSCHPSPCRQLSHGTVIEYYCDEGFILKGDYKYLTCQAGDWDGPMQISCLLDQDGEMGLPLGMPTLSIVASTASTVAMVLLLVVLVVLLQPKLKTFQRRDGGVLGQPVSIMVEGVQVTLPSYEEAVCGTGSPGGASGPSTPGLSSESRGQIVVSEGQGQDATQAGPSRPTSWQHQYSETPAVHPLPSSSSYSSSSAFSPSPSSSSGWNLERAASSALPAPHRRPSLGSEEHSMPVLHSDMDYADDMPLLKEA